MSQKKLIQENARLKREVESFAARENQKLARDKAIALRLAQSQKAANVVFAAGLSQSPRAEKGKLVHTPKSGATSLGKIQGKHLKILDLLKSKAIA